jgi:hypothetical protein
MARRPKGTSGYTVIELGKALLIRPEKTSGRKHRKEIKRPPKVIPVQPGIPNAAPGCWYVGGLYDQNTDTTTFIFDCDHVVDQSGHTSYTVTRRSYFGR